MGGRSDKGAAQAGHRIFQGQLITEIQIAFSFVTGPPRPGHPFQHFLILLNQPIFAVLEKLADGLLGKAGRTGESGLAGTFDTKTQTPQSASTNNLDADSLETHDFTVKVLPCLIAKESLCPLPQIHSMD